MIIDCHTHVTELRGKKWTAQELLRSMDEAGIDVSVVIASFFGGQGTHTKEIVEICKQNPRLKAVGNITYSELGPEQVEMIAGYIKSKDIVGVKLYLGYEEFYPFDEKLFLVYELCAANHIPVIFHTGILEASLKGRLRYSQPLHIDEVAGRFPDLKIIIAHMGNPWLMDCAAVMSRNQNVYADCSGYFKEFSAIAAEEVEFFKEQMRQFKLFVGDFKRILFGTDWPIYSQKEYLQAVQSLDLTSEERELFLYKNAQDLFAIK